MLKPAGTLLLVNEMVKDGVYEVENAEMIAKAHVTLLPLKVIKGNLRNVGFVNVKAFTKNKLTLERCHCTETLTLLLRIYQAVDTRGN